METKRKLIHSIAKRRFKQYQYGELIKLDNELIDALIDVFEELEEYEKCAELLKQKT